MYFIFTKETRQCGGTESVDVSVELVGKGWFESPVGEKTLRDVAPTTLRTTFHT
jgi:hypothetical protein